MSTQILNSEVPELEAKAYKLADRIVYNGLLVSLETKKGDVRKGIGKDGKPWEVTMPYDYGYLRNTEGADGQHVDVFIGPEKEASVVYVIHQKKENSEEYDEDKVMLGFDSKQDAVAAYKAAYTGVDLYLSTSIISFVDFVKQVYDKRNAGKRIEAGGEGSGWFANAGHIKHTIKTTQNHLKKGGWEARPSPNPGSHDQFVHPALPGHTLNTHPSGAWKHTVIGGATKTGAGTTDLLKHFESQGIYKKGEKPLFGYKPSGKPSAANPAVLPSAKQAPSMAKALTDAGFQYKGPTASGDKFAKGNDALYMKNGTWTHTDEYGTTVKSGKDPASLAQHLATLAQPAPPAKPSLITGGSKLKEATQNSLTAKGFNYLAYDKVHQTEHWEHAATGADLTIDFSKNKETTLYDKNAGVLYQKNGVFPSEIKNAHDAYSDHLAGTPTSTSPSQLTLGQQHALKQMGLEHAISYGTDQEDWVHPATGATVNIDHGTDTMTVKKANGKIEDELVKGDHEQLKDILDAQPKLGAQPATGSTLLPGEQQHMQDIGMQFKEKSSTANAETWEHPASGVKLTFNHDMGSYFILDKNDKLHEEDSIKDFHPDAVQKVIDKVGAPAAAPPAPAPISNSVTANTPKGQVLTSAGYLPMKSGGSYGGNTYEEWSSPKYDHTVTLNTAVDLYSIHDKNNLFVADGTKPSELEKHLDKFEQEHGATPAAQPVAAQPTAAPTPTTPAHPTQAAGPQIPAMGKNNALVNAGMKFDRHENGHDVWTKPGNDTHEVHVVPTDATHSDYNIVQKGLGVVSKGKDAAEMLNAMQTHGLIPKPAAQTPSSTSYAKAPSTSSKTKDPETIGFGTIGNRSDPKYNAAWQTSVHDLAGSLYGKPGVTTDWNPSSPNNIYGIMCKQLGVPTQTVQDVIKKFGDWQGGTTVKQGNPIGDWMQQVVNKMDGMHPGCAIEHAITQQRLKERADKGKDTAAGGVPTLYRGLSGNYQITADSLAANVGMLHQIAKTIAKDGLDYNVPFQTFGGEGFSSSKTVSSETFSNSSGVVITKPSGSLDSWNVISSRDLNPSFWKSFAGEHEWAIAPHNRTLQIDTKKGDKLTISSAADKEAAEAKVFEYLELLKKDGFDYKVDGNTIMMYWPQYMTFQWHSFAKPEPAGPSKPVDLSAQVTASIMSAFNIWRPQ